MSNISKAIEVDMSNFDGRLFGFGCFGAVSQAIQTHCKSCGDALDLHKDNCVSCGTYFREPTNKAQLNEWNPPAIKKFIAENTSKPLTRKQKVHAELHYILRVVLCLPLVESFFKKYTK